MICTVLTLISLSPISVLLWKPLLIQKRYRWNQTAAKYIFSFLRQKISFGTKAVCKDAKKHEVHLMFTYFLAMQAPVRMKKKYFSKNNNLPELLSVDGKNYRRLGFTFPHPHMGNT
jgi:hypothetical protein